MRFIFKKGRAASAGVVHTVSVAVLMLGAMAASAVAGAWVQSHYYSQSALAGPAVQAAGSPQVLRDSAYIHENIRLLANKVGDLQAKLISMGELSKRVALAADVSYTDPEIHASLEQGPAPMDDITGGWDQPDELSQPDEWGVQASAQSLGRSLDALQQQVSEQHDWFSMLDLVLTRRAGAQARLPTLMPVHYTYLSAPFGWRRNPVTGRHSMHEGMDFAAPKGTPVHAASGGVVTLARYHRGYGKMVEISHGNGLVTRYAHASEIDVKEGDLVAKGQLIARVGSTGRSTGAHLHFEVRMAGHPLDPALFLAQIDPPRKLVAVASKHG